jgi:hypothetical protein
MLLVAGAMAVGATGKPNDSEEVPTKPTNTTKI